MLKLKEFLKQKNSGEKFRQSYDLGDCINQLCDEYGFPEMKYSDEELDDMDSDYWREPWREPMSYEDFCSGR